MSASPCHWIPQLPWLSSCVAWRGCGRAILTALAGPGSAAQWEHVASGRSCSFRRPDRRDPSHVYPATSGIRSLLAASGCMGLEVARTAPNHITRGRGPFSLVWQVLGSNQRRLSRRFYRPLPLATRATCRRPPVPGGIARIAQDVARRLADGPFEGPGLAVRRDGPRLARLAWEPWHRKSLPLT